MLDEQVESLLAKYEDKLSFEGKTAFIAQCVRKGYVRNPEYAELSAAYFQDRRLEDSAIVLGSGRREVSVAHAVAQKYKPEQRLVQKRSYRDADRHVDDCVREGLFASAAVAAESQDRQDDMRMYQELNDFLVYGPYPELDVGLLFEAASAADSERQYRCETNTLSRSDELGLIQNAKYLRSLGELLLKIRTMNYELQDLA